MSRRRSYLASVAPIILGAGCLTDTKSTDEQSPTTDRPTTTSSTKTDQRATATSTETSRQFGETFVGESSVTPRRTTVVSAGLVFDSPDALRVVPATDWYLLVRLGVSDATASPDQFRLITENGQIDPNPGLYDVNRGWWDGSLLDTPGPLEPGETHWLVFDVPQLTAPAPRLRFTEESTTVEWTLPEETERRLASTPPTFSIRSVTVPDAVAPTEPINVEVTAENRGPSNGWFVGSFNEQTQRVPHPFAIWIESGNRETWHASFPNRAEYDIDAVQYSFAFLGGSQSYEVAIDRTTTTS